jgi:hypothetical protein
VNPVTSNGGKINSTSANISDLTASRAVVTDVDKNLISSDVTTANLTDLTDGNSTSLHIHDHAMLDNLNSTTYYHLTAAEYAALNTGSGTDNYVVKRDGTYGLKNSIIYDDGTKVGIGTTTPAAKLQIAGIPSTAFGIIAGNDITNGGMTNNTRKYLRIGCPSYDIDEEPVSIITADNNGSANILNIGGGTGAGNATTEIRLKTDVLNTTTGTDRVVIKSDGNVGIGTDTPTARLDVCEGGDDARISLVIGADANASPRTDSHNKHARIGCPHYDLDEEVSSILFCSNTSTENRLHWGGGSSSMNSATSHQFYTSASNTITIGTERVRIQSDGKVGIGTGDPAVELHVNGTIRSDDLTASMVVVTDASKNLVTGAVSHSELGFVNNTLVSFQPLTDESATDIFEVAIESGGIIGGKFSYTIKAISAGSHAMTLTGEVLFNAVYDGSIAANIAEVDEIYIGGGATSMSSAFGIRAGTNKVIISCNCNSGLSTPSITIRYKLEMHEGTFTIL